MRIISVTSNMKSTVQAAKQLAYIRLLYNSVNQSNAEIVIKINLFISITYAIMHTHNVLISKQKILQN